MSTGTTAPPPPTLTCRAAIVWGDNQDPKVEEIQVEPPRSGEVRLKMLFSSICHTDVLGLRGFPTPVFPRVLGHEGVGVVESVGEGVVRLEAGDLVIPTYLGECGDACENCRSGKTNLCQTYPLQAFTGLMADATTRMSVQLPDGLRIRLHHFLSCSTWSEYTVVDANYLVKVDPTIPLPQASLLSCGFTTGFGAVWKEAKVHHGSTVAVLGLGAVGLGVVEGARVQGASRIIGIDINERKRKVGGAMGMTDFINPNDGDEGSDGKMIKSMSISERVKQLTGGMGVDYSFECTGIPHLLNQALEAAKVGIGMTVMLGAGTDKSVGIEFATLLGCRTMKYAVFGGVKVQSDLPLIIHKCINNEIQNLEKLITHRVALGDIKRALELLKEPNCVKVLIHF
ncbi:CYP enzymes assisting alcohol dehydrogenase-like isoform X2 [Andrographis paniculata]|uniref:CYP enzymes assisting alcohol dehydrogenase-like isoform X2 n=1 Tax=Andrographis paniculata TaxID=175694 RepID=UPI0021E97E6B|nr:CYP enzymes assisting alcohol dehydrogenase-like isoform X2 [Andrographis paniculata]